MFKMLTMFIAENHTKSWLIKFVNQTQIYTAVSNDAVDKKELHILSTSCKSDWIFFNMVDPSTASCIWCNTCNTNKRLTNYFPFIMELLSYACCSRHLRGASYSQSYVAVAETRSRCFRHQEHWNHFASDTHFHSTETQPNAIYFPY